MKTIDTSEGIVIGRPGDEYHQAYADTCAIKSQQIILNEFGIPVSEDQCVKFSYEHGWYSGDGTSFEDVGNLLEHGGIPCHRKVDANVFDIVNELSLGHKIIVGVDSEELWGNPFMGWLNDFFCGETPDHAVIVSGIDTSNPDNVMVYITDPGNGDRNRAYPLDQFMNAWADSQCYMVATDIAVPSSSPSMANFDYGIGHIPNVAGMDYADFMLFHDISESIPVCDLAHDEPLYPMSSLVEAYFDVASEDLDFSQIFDNYSFVDYIDLDVVNQSMLNSYNYGLERINFTPDISWVSYADEHGYDSLMNDNYSEFLNSSIDHFNSIGDTDSAMYCQQQLHILDYCDNFDIDFFNSFYC